MKHIYSWNVNGIRACAKKGLLEWISETGPDILALQETKAQPEQLVKDLLDVSGYKSYWHSAARKGYSGVAVYTKKEPDIVEKLGMDEFDIEGRTMILHYS
ncbi:MAG TPA: exodeoxyribonuclease III, partial [Victivallales bacterium]|nr:exodeoxyribonuclease III [Victivallales bacterium]